MEQFARILTAFGSEATIRWSCREGDLVFWFRWRNLFTNNPSIQVLDFWSMRNGDFLTITNRLGDIPTWFELHPTEACNALSSRLMQKFRIGKPVPDSITDGSNIWRARTGDRIAWLGKQRPGQFAVNEVLSVLTFDASALVIGEGVWKTMEDAIMFGAPQRESPNALEKVRAQTALHLVEQLGIPDAIDVEWLLG